MLKTLELLVMLCCFAQVCFAQGAASPVNVVPITKEPAHHLVFENEYVRVFKVEVAPHAETLYHKHDVDYVFVTLGDSDVESVRVGEPPVRLQLKDGETRFTKGGFAHKAVNNSDKPFVNVTVELKKDQGRDATTGTSAGMGLVASKELLSTDQTKCFEMSTTGSGNGMGLPRHGERLVIPLSAVREKGSDQLLEKGSVNWNKGSVDFRGPSLPLRVVVCEFAREGEDFRKKPD
jgi:quercetin dioxygenase-like cupin family protein